MSDSASSLGDSVFRLHANCVPVKGAKRALICDLQSHKAFAIPQSLYIFLTETQGMSMQKIKAAFGDAEHATIDEYISFLVSNDLGAWCRTPSRFPNLDLSWDRAEVITNAIVDVDGTSDHDFSDIFQQLTELGCEALQVRCFVSLPFDEIRKIIKAVDGYRFRHFDLVLRYNPGLDQEAFRLTAIESPQLVQVLFHGSPVNQRSDLRPYPVAIIHTTQILSEASCGTVSPQYFATGIEHFVEAQNHNTCLNRKISICADGSIRPCPSMPLMLGNIKQVTLRSTLSDSDYQKLGNISKDQVEVCRDCEFRYICTDCRAHVTDSRNLYSKPAKCSYDPYTAKWIDAPEQVRTVVPDAALVSISL